MSGSILTDRLWLQVRLAVVDALWELLMLHGEFEWLDDLRQKAGDAYSSFVDKHRREPPSYAVLTHRESQRPATICHFAEDPVTIL